MDFSVKFYKDVRQKIKNLLWLHLGLPNSCVNNDEKSNVGPKRYESILKIILTLYKWDARDFTFRQDEGLNKLCNYMSRGEI